MMDQAQKQLLYESKKKSTGLAYVFFLLLGCHYAYLGDWGKQLLFWITGGGLGIWVLIDLFRMSSLVREHNTRVMLECDILYNNSSPNVVVQVQNDATQPSAPNVPKTETITTQTRVVAPDVVSQMKTKGEDVPPSDNNTSTSVLQSEENDISPFHTPDGVMRGYMFDHVVYATKEDAEIAKAKKNASNNE